MNLSSLLKRSAVLSVSVALAGGLTAAAAQHGLYYTTPTHSISITTSDTAPRTLRVNPSANEAPTDRLIRSIQRSHGIPPCRWEDGAGQRGACYWDGATFGNGHGRSYVLVPSGVNAQKRAVYLDR